MEAVPISPTLVYQSVDLSFDFSNEQVLGNTVLWLMSSDDIISGNFIHIHSRQSKILNIFVNDVPAEFMHVDPLHSLLFQSDAKPSYRSEELDLNYRAGLEVSKQGELRIIVPKSHAELTDAPSGNKWGIGVTHSLNSLPRGTAKNIVQRHEKLRKLYDSLTRVVAASSLSSADIRQAMAPSYSTSSRLLQVRIVYLLEKCRVGPLGSSAKQSGTDDAGNDDNINNHSTSSQQQPRFGKPNFSSGYVFRRQAPFSTAGLTQTSNVSSNDNAFGTGNNSTSTSSKTDNQHQSTVVCAYSTSGDCAASLSDVDGVRCWLPCLDQTDQLAVFDITLHASKSFNSVVSSGSKVAVVYETRDKAFAAQHNAHKTRYGVSSKPSGKSSPRQRTLSDATAPTSTAAPAAGTATNASGTSAASAASASGGDVGYAVPFGGPAHKRNRSDSLTDASAHGNNAHNIGFNNNTGNNNSSSHDGNNTYTPNLASSTAGSGFGAVSSAGGGAMTGAAAGACPVTADVYVATRFYCAHRCSAMNVGFFVGSAEKYDMPLYKTKGHMWVATNIHDFNAVESQVKDEIRAQGASDLESQVGRMSVKRMRAGSWGSGPNNSHPMSCEKDATSPKASGASNAMDFMSVPRLKQQHADNTCEGALPALQQSLAYEAQIQHSCLGLDLGLSHLHESLGRRLPTDQYTMIYVPDLGHNFLSFDGFSLVDAKYLHGEEEAFLDGVHHTMVVTSYLYSWFKSSLLVDSYCNQFIIHGAVAWVVEMYAEHLEGDELAKLHMLRCRDAVLDLEKVGKAVELVSIYPEKFEYSLPWVKSYLVNKSAAIFNVIENRLGGKNAVRLALQELLYSPSLRSQTGESDDTFGPDINSLTDAQYAQYLETKNMLTIYAASKVKGRDSRRMKQQLKAYAADVGVAAGVSSIPPTPALMRSESGNSSNGFSQPSPQFIPQSPYNFNMPPPSPYYVPQSPFLIPQSPCSAPLSSFGEANMAEFMRQATAVVTTHLEMLEAEQISLDRLTTCMSQACGITSDLKIEHLEDLIYHTSSLFLKLDVNIDNKVDNRPGRSVHIALDHVMQSTHPGHDYDKILHRRSNGDDKKKLSGMVSAFLHHSTVNKCKAILKYNINIRMEEVRDNTVTRPTLALPAGHFKYHSQALFAKAGRICGKTTKKLAAAAREDDAASGIISTRSISLGGAMGKGKTALEIVDDLPNPCPVRYVFCDPYFCFIAEINCGGLTDSLLVKQLFSKLDEYDFCRQVQALRGLVRKTISRRELCDSEIVGAHAITVVQPPKAGSEVALSAFSDCILGEFSPLHFQANPTSAPPEQSIYLRCEAAFAVARWQQERSPEKGANLSNLALSAADYYSATMSGSWLGADLLIRCLVTLYIDKSSLLPIYLDMNDESAVLLRNALLLALSTVKSGNGITPVEISRILLMFADHVDDIEVHVEQPSEDAPIAAATVTAASSSSSSSSSSTSSTSSSAAAATTTVAAITPVTALPTPQTIKSSSSSSSSSGQSSSSSSRHSSVSNIHYKAVLLIALSRITLADESQSTVDKTIQRIVSFARQVWLSDATAARTQSRIRYDSESAVNVMARPVAGGLLTACAVHCLGEMDRQVIVLEGLKAVTMVPSVPSFDSASSSSSAAKIEHIVWCPSVRGMASDLLYTQLFLNVSLQLACANLPRHEMPLNYSNPLPAVSTDSPLCPPLVRATALEQYVRLCFVQYLKFYSNASQDHFTKVHLTKEVSSGSLSVTTPTAATTATSKFRVPDNVFISSALEAVLLVIHTDPDLETRRHAAVTWLAALQDLPPRMAVSALSLGDTYQLNYGVHDVEGLTITPQKKNQDKYKATMKNVAAAFKKELKKWWRCIVASTAYDQTTRGVLLQAWMFAFGRTPPVGLAVKTDSGPVGTSQSQEDDWWQLSSSLYGGQADDLPNHRLDVLDSYDQFDRIELGLREGSRAKHKPAHSLEDKLIKAASAKTKLHQQHQAHAQHASSLHRNTSSSLSSSSSAMMPKTAPLLAASDDIPIAKKSSDGRDSSVFKLSIASLKRQVSGGAAAAIATSSAIGQAEFFQPASANVKKNIKIVLK